MREFYALRERFKESQEWLNFRTALVCSVIANMFRDSKRKAYTPQDFMPRTEPKRQTWEQMVRMVELLNAAYGGNIAED